MEANDVNYVVKSVDAKQKQDQEMLSAEDLAWADSCLIEDPEISNTNLNSLKEALLEIVDQHSKILGPPANEQGGSNDIADPEEGTSPTAPAEASIEEHPEHESSPDVFSLKQPFLPNYNDEMLKIQYSDDEDDVGFKFSEFVMEPQLGDIFKVWDLDVSVEEDEFDKELKEALSSDAPTRARKKKGLESESLDGLIQSIADLSLERKNVGP